MTLEIALGSCLAGGRDAPLYRRRVVSKYCLQVCFGTDARLSLAPVLPRGPLSHRCSTYAFSNDEVCEHLSKMKSGTMTVSTDLLQVACVGDHGLCTVRNILLTIINLTAVSRAGFFRGLRISCTVHCFGSSRSKWSSNWISVLHMTPLLWRQVRGSWRGSSMTGLRRSSRFIWSLLVRTGSHFQLWERLATRCP